MIIIGLECPCCGCHVLDSGDSCLGCGKKYPPEITALQAAHHAEKMLNVGRLQAGDMTMPEALMHLPRVRGQSEDKIVVTLPGHEEPRKITFKKKMDCDACEAVAGVFRSAVVRIKSIFGG